VSGAVAHDDPSRAREQVAATLAAAVEALDGARIPYVLTGGIASAVHGRPRFTDDIDLFVKRDDALRALAALDEAGFETEETNPEWIYKAVRRGVSVDLIFWLKGDIYLDDEMLERAPEAEFEGVRVRVMPPEDLIVVKAVIHDEQTPRHWGDALGVIADADIDWEYLARRARKGARRVLALLVYAQSNDLVVTDESVRGLYEAVYGPGASSA
jgi:predicted nucleotidyltransferase